MNIYLLYFLTGSLGGFFGGLLGLGGGIIFVPFLFFIFNEYGINSEYVMQSAICTSLSCIVVSSIASTYKHNKNNLIDWIWFRRLLPGLIIGSCLGIILISYLPNNEIKFYYGIFLILIAIYVLFDKAIESRRKFKLGLTRLFSLLSGLLSSFLGIGGGTINTPYFKIHGKLIKESIATAAACGIPIALSAVTTSIVINYINGGHINFIHKESFLVVALSSIVFSYIGASTTKFAETSIIKILFSISVLIMGIIIIIF
tara:strand:- start:6 stop:779 length:774 start_codon:yes stop_codon:yes gene_type:complete